MHPVTKKAPPWALAGVFGVDSQFSIGRGGPKEWKTIALEVPRCTKLWWRNYNYRMVSEQRAIVEVDVVIGVLIRRDAQRGKRDFLGNGVLTSLFVVGQ
jgi:hypothetical protein